MRINKYQARLILFVIGMLILWRVVGWGGLVFLWTTAILLAIMYAALKILGNLAKL